MESPNQEAIYQDIIAGLVRDLARAREDVARIAAERDAARAREDDRGGDTLKIWRIIAPVRESDGSIESPDGLVEVLNRCRWLVARHHELERLESAPRGD